MPPGRLLRRHSRLASFDVGTEFRTQETAPQTHRGDLFNYLPLDPWFSALLPPTETIVPTSTEAVAQGNDLFGDDSAPKITLVGTSYSANRLWNFAGALKQALHEDLLNYAKDGKGPFAPMLDYLNSDDIKQAPPRLVIWEIPERYLPAAPALETYVIPPEAYATAGRNTPILKNRRNS